MHRRGDPLYERAAGHADRADAVTNTLVTRFGLASGCKGLTALAAMALAGDGALTLNTPVRTLLGDALPLVDDAVTIEHLLAHTSGIGDSVWGTLSGHLTGRVLGWARASRFSPVWSDVQPRPAPWRSCLDVRHP